MDGTQSLGDEFMPGWVGNVIFSPGPVLTSWRESQLAGTGKYLLEPCQMWDKEKGSMIYIFMY
jgi:hypothetical protein